MVERARRCPTDRRSLPLSDGRGELQLEVYLPLRVPGRRGEGRHLEEGVHVLLGRDHQQGSGKTDFTGKAKIVVDVVAVVAVVAVVINTELCRINSVHFKYLSNKAKNPKLFVAFEWRSRGIFLAINYIFYGLYHINETIHFMA